jgi:outer membrane protein assembly factor BamB
MRARPFYVIGLLLLGLLAGCGGSTAGTKATPTSTTLPTATPVPHQLGAYLGTGKTLFALDPVTGAQRWKYDVTEPSAIGSIQNIWVVDDTVFFAIGNTSWLYAISTSTGALRWKVHEGGNSADPFGPVDQLVVASGVVYTASTASQVPSGTFAINLASGQVLWHKDGPATLAADAHTVYLIERPYPQGGAPTNGTISALKASDANVLWQVKDHPFGVLIVDGGALYVTAGKTRLAFNTQIGAPLWTKDFDGSLYTLIKGANTLYLSDEVTLYALDPTTQILLWQTPLANNGIMLYRNGYLFVMAYKQIYGVNATSGERLWAQSIVSGFASAVSMNDTASFMHVGDPYGGNLYAVATSTGKALWTSKTIAVYGPTYATATSVYALSGLGNTQGQSTVVQALSAMTGALQWKFDAHSQYPGSLVVG